jgi:aspartate racemase
LFHIGVLAPGLDGAAGLLRHIRARSTARLPAGPYPEITLSCATLDAGPDPWQRGDHDAVRAQLILGSARLRHAGADFVVCPDDTAYLALGMPGLETALPSLHVAAVVAAEAQRRGHSQVAILGTRWTLGWRRYAEVLGPMGIETVPLPPSDQTTLHSIIFDELVQGRSDASSRDAVLGMIAALQLRGCKAVVVGCHELSSLVTPASSTLPLLNATALLADAAVAVATGDVELPRWRGGAHVDVTADSPYVNAFK